MADLATSNHQEYDKNLERLRANVRELVNAHKKAQENVDQVNAWIAKEGPSARYGRWLNNRTKEQLSGRTRSDIAVSVIGLSIKDMTETIREPPSVISIKDLMDTMDDLDDNASVYSLGEALTLVRGTNASSLADVFEDFETTYQSLSKERTSRMIKTLEVTHLAVRDLADPGGRFKRLSEARKDALNRAFEKMHQADQPDTAIATVTSRPSHSKVVQVLLTETTTKAIEHNLDALVPTQILNALSLYKYIHVMLTYAPSTRVAEALQKLVENFRSELEDPEARSSKEGEDPDVVLTGQDELSGGSGDVKAEHADLDDDHEIERPGHRFETEDDHKSRKRRS